MQHEACKAEQSAGQGDHDKGDRPMLHIASAREGDCPLETAETVHIESLRASALTGVYEITKVLTAPCRLEITLAKVVELLQSFVQMRHGTVSLLDDDGIPKTTVGAGWTDGSDERYRMRLPLKAIDHIVATDRPLIAENVAIEPAFTAADVHVLGASNGVVVSFIGIPIRIDAKVMGALTIDRIVDNKSSARLDYDVRLLTMIADLVGQTVRLHRSFTCDRDQVLAERGSQEQQSIEHKQPARERKKVRIPGIIGDSPPLHALLEKIAVVSKSNSAVLLRGESGTGKELVAKAIHELSSRAKRPFIKLNCAALSETVLESELFGHEKGAFTGAFSSRKGRFELADKGTLFLDEIGEISPSFQAKLLRVLQEQEFERVGSNQTIKVDVRLIAATNKNLEEAVIRNEFRADLYYRISVVPLLLPPLRERRDDIALLAAEFLKKFNRENGRTLVFDSSAIVVLMNCGFPGNVRELENCVERTATLALGQSIVKGDFACCQGQCLSAKLWRSKLHETTLVGELDVPAPTKPITEPTEVAAPAAPYGGELASLVPARAALVGGPRIAERERVVAAMERSGWVQAKAARLLGVTPRQIGYALKKYGIEIKRF
ncbi:nif-specific transcriptional activator NifA [Bradyrhizobium sp. CCGE-LA001]|uniref:nif-specific transcriptional activator NifA n=1 Tax=Bradyrhizobium sp. CCGE-LA001 TaxID=1223566 RepID=UPI0002AA8993|nr:nif-specific transcriptional activator NifA [Bradyrhizobium sp. CCGE-LA001]AMA59880.1 nif-specific transcriptional activator NifA [Bradyrhizobium sp. CCGE-LA001]